MLVESWPTNANNQTNNVPAIFSLVISFPQYTVGGEYSTTLQDPKKSVITVGIETALEGGQILKSKIDTKVCAVEILPPLGH